MVLNKFGCRHKYKVIQPLLFHLFIGSTSKRPISPRVLVHSLISFAYFDLGGLVLSVYGWIVLKLNPKAHLKEQTRLHRLTSKFMKSVLYTNPFMSKEVRNLTKSTFDKPAMVIANHSSFLDILATGMLHPKLIYLVKDHVYNSPVIGSAAKLHGAYPVSGGIENGEAFLQQKVKQGFSIIAFPEGARSTTNKIGRFHKGAFYLAEKLQLDLLPVLIHGGSELSPKNSFIIRDGSFTIEILPRISATELTFGATYSERPKKFGEYFRKEFRRLRNEIEDETYWHDLLLENYKHKGHTLYQRVKADLQQFSTTYISILRTLEEKNKIIHISDDDGQLDLLLALDSFDRKIYSFLEDDLSRSILKNNYLTHQYSKITVVNSINEVFEQQANAIIINTDCMNFEEIAKHIHEEMSILILLKSGLTIDTQQLLSIGFKIEFENTKLKILKRTF